MKRLLLAVALAGMIGLVLGCDRRGASPTDPGQPAQEAPVMAHQIDDGAQPLFPMQMFDPVSQKWPIRPELYVDVEGGRVYFHSQESIEEFNRDRNTYLRKLQEMSR